MPENKDNLSKEIKTLKAEIQSLRELLAELKAQQIRLREDLETFKKEVKLGVY